MDGRDCVLTLIWSSSLFLIPSSFCTVLAVGAVFAINVLSGTVIGGPLSSACLISETT